MSKQANHWYLAGSTLESIRKALFRRPRMIVVVWAVLVAFFLVVWELIKDRPTLGHAPPQPSMLSTLVPMVVMLVGLAGFVFWQWSRFRRGYLAALALPDPGFLVAHVDRSLKAAQIMPDWDAMAAQARALAFSLYGRADEATAALAAVEWRGRAPMIQGIGLNGEGVVELLCHRNAGRALELTRRARELSAVSARLPGAAQSRRFHDTCVAVAEVLAGVRSPQVRPALDAGAAARSMPQLQILASFGLALLAEREGDGERAGVLRAFLRQVAPHCRPLHLGADAFTTGDAAAPGPVSSTVTGVAEPAAVLTQATATKRRALRAVGVMVGLWVLLIGAFAAVYLLFNQHR
jgi:hypothetical protein